ncbi:MAG: sulfotransferase family 2 domain-containing protein [Longimicrobiales bacterium]
MARIQTKYLLDVIFVHINKTGGSSIEAALGLPFQHCTAAELRTYLGQRRWQERFSFAFVRNPWDKVASHYAYRVKTNQTGLGDRHLEFKTWVRLAYGDREPRYHDQQKMFMPQTEWIADASGAILVNFVGRFERLNEDFAEVCRHTGRKGLKLPHLKRSAPYDYRRTYDDESAAIVAHWFAADIQQFGYTFDPVGEVGANL